MSLQLLTVVALLAVAACPTVQGWAQFDTCPKFDDHLESDQMQDGKFYMGYHSFRCSTGYTLITTDPYSKQAGCNPGGKWAMDADKKVKCIHVATAKSAGCLLPTIEHGEARGPDGSFNVQLQINDTVTFMCFAPTNVHPGVRRFLKGRRTSICDQATQKVLDVPTCELVHKKYKVRAIVHTDQEYRGYYYSPKDVITTIPSGDYNSISELDQKTHAMCSAFESYTFQVMRPQTFRTWAFEAGQYTNHPSVHTAVDALLDKIARDQKTSTITTYARVKFGTGTLQQYWSFTKNAYGQWKYSVLQRKPAADITVICSGWESLDMPLPPLPILPPLGTGPPQ